MQAAALSEICAPQSGQVIKAMLLVGELALTVAMGGKNSTRFCAHRYAGQKLPPHGTKCKLLARTRVGNPGQWNQDFALRLA